VEVLTGEGKGFQMAQAEWPLPRKREGMALSSSEQPGTSRYLGAQEPAWPQAWRESRGEVVLPCEMLATQVFKLKEGCSMGPGH
jgi:hypothetical protein